MVTEIDLYPPSRPRFTTPSIQSTTHHPACTHTRTVFIFPLSTSPFRLMVICFPCFLHVSQLSHPCFHDRFSHIFSLRCLFLPLSSGSGSRPLINRPSTTRSNDFFRSIQIRISPHPDRLCLGISGNSQQYHMGKHLDIFLPLF